jgi:phospholipid/cholesterol/gamma-HCH transport system substrate-binding protein
MKKNIFETLTGFAVIVASVVFTVIIYNHAKSSYQTKGSSYELNAKFGNISGIIKGSDVMIAGINVGEVVDMSLDPQTYEAIVTINVSSKVLVPVDSKASIVSSGFVGNKFIAIDPGVDKNNLKNGGTIAYTNSALNLETLIGKFMYSFGNKSS